MDMKQRGNLSEITEPEVPQTAATLPSAGETVEHRVLRVIAVTRRVPIETIHADSTFEELGIDSLDRINILFELEGEFDIEIDDEQAKQVTTLRQMIEGIAQLLAAKTAKSAG